MNPSEPGLEDGRPAVPSSLSRFPSPAVLARHRWLFRYSGAGAGDLASLLSRRRAVVDLSAEEAGGSPLARLPRPELFKDMERSVERILTALATGERITIFGDYDVDGTSSSALLRRFFRELGTEVHTYIPDRLKEGYGLNAIGLANIQAAGGGLVVTVDNGIAAVAACHAATEMGIDVIITDHHDVPPELPRAYAILNPKQAGCEFPYKMLAGVGVAFYLAIGIRAGLRAAAGRPGLERYAERAAGVRLRELLDLVALGTIADLAPLDGVNHLLCRTGLQVMTEQVASGARPGIAALLRLAGWEPGNGIDASDVGFKIGPRLNAAGRLGTACAARDVLETDDPALALELAAALHEENKERQLLEKASTEQALAQVLSLGNAGSLPQALVLHCEDWHPGVVGLVASRVVEKHYRPTLALTTFNGKVKGSGRSIHGFDLFASLDRVRDQFESFGGHKYAVGLTISPEKVGWLRDYLVRSCAETLDESDFTAPLWIDGLLRCDQLSEELLQELASLEPFGIENPRPKWLVSGAFIRHVKRIGKSPDANHARFLLEDASGAQVWCTGFGWAEIGLRASRCAKGCDIVLEGRLRCWQGSIRPEWTLVDIRTCDADAVARDRGEA